MNKNQTIFVTAAITALLFVTVAANTATTNDVQASQGFFGKLADSISRDLENLGDDIDSASENYQQGVEDGKNAGVNGRDGECPSSDTVYCVGWNTGYGTGSRAVETVNENTEKRVINTDN